MASLSGLLLALSFPTILFGHELPDLSLLAWVALLPLLLAVKRQSLAKVFLLSLWCSFIFTTASLFWIAFALHQVPHYSWPVSLLFLAGVGLLVSPCIAFAFLVAGRIERKTNIPFYLLLPLSWFCFESFLSLWPLGGFPWLQLGYTQYRHLTLIQSADLFGVAGISSVIVLENCLLFETVRRLIDGKRRAFVHYLTAAVLVAVLNSGYGWFRISAIESRTVHSETIRIAAIPGDIPQQKKWDPRFQEEILKKYQADSFKAVDEGTDLIVWPEMAPPYYIPRDAHEWPSNVTNLKTPLLTG